MHAVKKTDYLPDAATLDLWRVAEEGDVGGLALVLARVRDINARNEHGVTALMRAAQYGHVKMVRALLDRGADANIKRNDKFTALALAAFFGHTEIVRVLMEHGADSQASTRYDTSPHMWATARTFNEVVDQLEKPAPVVAKPAPVPKPTPVAQPTPVAKPAPLPKKQEQAPALVAINSVPVVRTLKDPPEIWDLVHEVPRGFNPRSAFLTRLRSIQGGWAFRMAAVLVLIGAGVAGVMLLRGVQARNEAVSKAPQPVSVAPNASAPSAFVPPSVSEPSTSAAIENNATATDPVVVTRKPGSRWPRANSHRAERDVASQVAASETVQPVATPAAKASPEQRAEVQPKPNANLPLSPQLIAPAKNAAPKGKVIQWP